MTDSTATATGTPEVRSVCIGDRWVGEGHPVFVIAELSANHGGSLDRALELVRLAAEADADAVKLQTFTPDTMTLDLGDPPFVVGGGTLWDGRRLYSLYAEAMTPWEWHAPLARAAIDAGLQWLSSPFDRTAVDFLHGLDAPAYKIASFELLDLDLISACAATGRPLIVSTGMATSGEIDLAVQAARQADAGGLVLLRCNSSYPAEPAEMDLRTMTDMRGRWSLPVGLSDHTLSETAALSAVALGATVIEKHFCLSRDLPGPDSAFSLEPAELASLVAHVREAEAALGGVRYGPSPSETKSLAFRRSLWFVADLAAGDVITEGSIGALRPAGGLPPADRRSVIGRRVVRSVGAGTPVTDDVIAPADQR